VPPLLVFPIRDGIDGIDGVDGDDVLVIAGDGAVPAGYADRVRDAVARCPKMAPLRPRITWAGER
jgi:hypothetical protein